MVNGIGFVISKEEEFGTRGPGLITQDLLYGRVLLKYEKGTENPSDIDIRGGMESAPFTNVSKGVIYFLIGYYS